MNNELIDLQKMWQAFQKRWAASFAVVLFFILGIIIGMVIVRNSVVDDCKYMNAFRIGDQSFNCSRKI